MSAGGNYSARRYRIRRACAGSLPTCTRISRRDAACFIAPVPPRIPSRSVPGGGGEDLLQRDVDPRHQRGGATSRRLWLHRRVSRIAALSRRALRLARRRRVGDVARSGRPQDRHRSPRRRYRRTERRPRRDRRIAMLMVESDGKALLRSCGIAVPEGTVVAAGETPTPSGADPWIVKAQVPVGGRGKAGGVIRCDSAAAVHATLKRMFDISIKGHLVHRCLIEHPATGTETYLSLMLDPANYGVRVTLIREGGVNVEKSGLSKHNSRLCEPEHTAIVAALGELTAELALLDFGDKLV